MAFVYNWRHIRYFLCKEQVVLWFFCLNCKAISKAIDSNCPFNLAFSGTLVSKTKPFPIKFGDMFVQHIFLGDWFPAVDLGLTPTRWNTLITDAGQPRQTPSHYPHSAPLLSAHCLIHIIPSHTESGNWKRIWEYQYSRIKVHVHTHIHTHTILYMYK